MNLAQQMSLAAEKDKEPGSPFLHRKIMAGLNADEYALGYSARARLGWALAFGAACLAAAAAVWWYQSPARDQVASKTSPAPTALTVDLPSLAQVDQWTTNLDSPLEHETQLVLSDANSALKTLAHGLLPQELLRSPADNDQR